MKTQNSTRPAWAIAILALAALAVAPRPAAAEAGVVETASDLLSLCADPSEDTRIACKYFVLGALQSAGVMHAADTGQPRSELYCAADSVTNSDLILAIRNLVTAHPERLNFPAASVVVGGAIEAYPCKHTPAHPSAARRRTSVKPKP